MTKINRRKFLDQSTKAGVGLAAGLTILENAASVRATPANNKVVLAMIGTGGRGTNLAGDFAARGDCEFAYVCDPDENRSGPAAKMIAAKQGKAPKTLQDFRKMLADKSVDAVVVATPDHWHAPATVWACQAGKDVYVEKPPTSNIWEGKKMIEAARKYSRIVQVGTQNRSAAYNKAAKKYIEDGKLGSVHMVRVYNQKTWQNFDAVPDADPPQGLDWDIWNGPAPQVRYNRNFHHNWHHFWRYSGGDIINDGIHQMDLARWVIGVDYPKAVYSTGGRWDKPGVAETPDTQVAVFDFDKMVMTFELTLYTPYMFKISPIIRQAMDKFPYWPQCATRIEIYGSAGLMYLGRHGGGWQVFDKPKLQSGVVKDQMKGLFPDPEHKENFLHCIRTRETPNADIQEGHRSTLLSHYANISYRLGGEKLLIDRNTEEIVGNDKAMALFKRDYRKPYVIEDHV
jgi:predicted dehydrogenase